MKLVQENQNWAAIPSLPENFPMSSYAEATKLAASVSDSTTYTVDIKRDWSIASIPHGGYLLTVATIAAKSYMLSHQAQLKQPGLISSHVEFLSRTTIGHGTLSITPLKLGRQFSTLRVQLLQYDPKSKSQRLCLESLITQGNLASEAHSPNSSITLPVRPLPFSIPQREDCEPWDFDPRWPSRRPAAWKLSIFYPPHTTPSTASPTYGPSVREQWMRWAPSIGTRFTIDSLPYLADSFRPLPEAYGLVGNWYATLSYGVEVKRAPDEEEGWEWLFMRVEMGEVRNGRFGMEVWIFDEEERLVARSWHTALILGTPSERKGIERAVEGAKI